MGHFLPTKQGLKVGSTLLSVSKGAPQGYVLGPSLYPMWLCPNCNPLIFITFADDTVLLGLIRGEKAAQRLPHLSQQPRDQRSFFLDTNISEELTWTHNTKTAASVPSICASLLLWERPDLAWSWEKPCGVTKSTLWPALDGISTSCCLQRETNIFEDSSQPTYHLFELLPSVRQHRNTPPDFCSLFIHCTVLLWSPTVIWDLSAFITFSSSLFWVGVGASAELSNQLSPKKWILVVN